MLIGIAAGIMLKLIIHLTRGVSFGELFKVKTIVQENTITVVGPLLFSNFLGVKKQISNYPLNSQLIFNISNCKLIDHSVIETLHHLEEEFKNEGGQFVIRGFEKFNSSTDHPDSVHKNQR